MKDKKKKNQNNDDGDGKYRHFSFSQRVTLQYCLDHNCNKSAALLARALKVSRWAIYYEIRNNTSTFRTTDVVFNHGKAYHCPKWDRFPFTCNGCEKTGCSHRRYLYDAYKADEKARKKLRSSRSDLLLVRNTLKVLIEQVSPLIRQEHSIHTAKVISGCPYSESTIRNCIEKERLDVKRVDLPRAVRFRAKKQ